MNSLHTLTKAGSGAWLILAIALWPSTASANAGTPLIWATVFHLAVGNAFIGLLEGLLVSWIFRAPARRAIWTLIAANYLSACAGTYLLGTLRGSVTDLTIENIRSWIGVYAAMAFLGTLLIEFVFFWFAMRPQRSGLMRASRAAFVVNAMSYLLLVGWYWMFSNTSMISQLQVVSPGSLGQTGNYALYYISTDGRQVIQSDLHGDNEKVLSTVTSTHRNDRLFARPNESNGYDLFIHLESESGQQVSKELIAADFSFHAPVENANSSSNTVMHGGTHFNFGEVPSLAANSSCEFRTGFWAAEGIKGKNKYRKDSVQYALDTPFVSWGVRNATQLDGDIIVFQLGKDQICMMHPETGRIALIARGKGPIVALPKPRATSK